MALAVKNMPETTSERSLNRLAVGSIAGTLYVLVSLGIVFRGLPLVWSLIGLGPALTASVGLPVSIALLTLVMIAAVAGLGWLGTRLVGPRPVPALKAGIFCVSWVLQ